MADDTPRDPLYDFGPETASQEDRRRCPPKGSPYEEYEFLVSVLDRVFLRLLGFSGSYTDWRRKVFEVEPLSGTGPAGGGPTPD